MGLTTTEPDTESSLLLPPTTTTTNSTISQQKIPKDTFHLAYIFYFTLGLGFLLPWNAFITAVDYFSYIYPDVLVDRIFSVAYMFVALACLVVIIFFYAHKSDAYLRINLGLGLFIVALLVVPVMDAVYIKGRVGLWMLFILRVCLYTEIPVTILTCLLGLTNGYLISVLMILAPKVVPLRQAETAGFVMVLYLVSGLAAGSIVAWFWVI